MNTNRATAILVGVLCIIGTVSGVFPFVKERKGLILPRMLEHEQPGR